MAEKDPKYIQELSDRRAKDPKEFDKQKSQYDAAMKQDAEDKDYSAVDTLKRVAKKAVGMKKGGCVCMSKGGSASKRADGCATRGKTRGRMV